GKGLLKAGHDVMFSSRAPEDSRGREIHQETGTLVGTVAETLAYSEIVAIALGADAITGVIEEFAPAWKGKIIIDLNNSIRPMPPQAGSVGQAIAQMTGGRVVKAFNSIGAEHFQNPVFNGQKATMLVAGDDTQAKSVVMGLAADLGFEPIDAGGLAVSGLLESMARLWVNLASNAGLGRNIAFKLLKR
ncbi:MAG TPA: NAD(P)-binding domain-containing protein, partial [Aggregatilineales bacterium]|nr:NAD(P)-binding domain-containing protein [Aggregatilineales bacterium]